MQVQVTKKLEVIYDFNIGQKNEEGDSVDQHTLFRIASISKSCSSVAIMQLVEQKKLSLNQSLTSIFGYTIENPNFPGVDITLEMILSHRSSLLECEPYYQNFKSAIAEAKSGAEIPDIKEILLEGGKFYSDCLFSKTNPPGIYYRYANLNYGIAGTIIEIISGIRFDEYQRDHILTHISEGLPEVATFNPATINNPNNLGVIYIGDEGKWIPNYDYYPSGSIPQKNLTGYRIGTNGVIYSPQAGLRLSASHLSNYTVIFLNGGKTRHGKTIISPESVAEILRPRYQYHGEGSGELNEFHAYGLGIIMTTYRKNDIVINHEVVKGHHGEDEGLIAGQFFWKDYTMVYAISGALNGYNNSTGTIYEYERLAIHSAV